MSEGAISLHFGLKDGEVADLEVVAAAALEWIAAIRAGASALSPGAEVRVGLIDAEEGSLNLHAVLQWVEDQLGRIQEGAGRYPRLRNLALALAIFVLTHAADRGLDMLMEKAGLSETAPALSDQDRQLLEQFLDNLKKSPEIEERKRRFFKTLEKDPSIIEAGISEGRGKVLLVSVPSTQFAEKSGLWEPIEQEEERTKYHVIDVTLISPMLVKKHRAWKFQPEGLPEFSATMKDERFLAALENSKLHETLRTGIPMKIRLEVKEHKVGGDWEVKQRGRSVVEVISPQID